MKRLDFLTYTITLLIFTLLPFKGLTQTCTAVINTYPYNETFESGLGNWSNVSGDDFNWTRDRWGTPSTLTGPSSSVGSAANNTDYYMYIEWEDIQTANKLAYIESDCFDLSPLTNPSISFYYQMYGEHMGRIRLLISNDMGITSWIILFNERYDQGTNWHSVTVDLSTYAGDNVQFRFQGKMGTEFRSDAAIDEIFVGEASILPIELSSFDADCINEMPTLNWTTSSEINNDYFTIERSEDGVSFEAVGTINGNGNSSTLKNYSWTDDNPTNETTYYRLKQTDFNGAFEYHGIRPVVCETSDEISIYPSPFKNSFTIKLSNNTIYPARIEVMDYLGRKVYSQALETPTTNIALDDLPNGTYFVKVTSDNTQVVKRIVKMK
ncbi:MAG: hypothetical protein COB15_00855 [Flavobacteriales bacterium]|nr:MAG: hypothetical protein COB15_00855 [Flavobacteriales bacterium]